MTVAMADLVLDAAEELSILLTSWTPTSWQQLLHAASHPTEGLDHVRALVTARAAMMRRLPLHAHVHARLNELIPNQPEGAAQRRQLTQLLGDACLAMVMSDAINPQQYHALSAALHSGLKMEASRDQTVTQADAT